MRSRAQIKAHPIHPALIPFPFAFLIGALVFDAVGLILGRPELWRTGGHLTIAGIATGLLAAIPGVIDYISAPAPGIEIPAHTRVVAHDTGSVYTFTMHQAPGMPDETFDAQVAELARELSVLKAHLETACPL